VHLILITQDIIARPSSPFAVLYHKLFFYIPEIARAIHVPRSATPERKKECLFYWVVMFSAAKQLTAVASP
jgi:hypothetical protein